MTETAAPQSPSPAESRAEFERRFRPIDALVRDEQANFNGAKVFADLVVLQKRARALGEDSKEHAEILALMALVQAKREDFEDALELGTRSLEIQERTAPLPDAFHQRHLLVTSAEALQLLPEAVGHLKLLLPVAEHEASLTPKQKLGLQQHLGYLLHEQGEFEEACQVNLAMLEEAEELLGVNDPALTGVLANIAQNHYSLELPEEAEGFLRRRLAIADAAGKVDIALDSIFQLAVLAFETGRVAHSRRLFEERLARAKATGDAELIEGATADLAEHERRAAAAAGG